MTTESAMIHVRVDPKLKNKATRTLSKMGLSMSDAIRLFLTRVEVEQALPFEVRVPNATTIAAMQAGGRGEVKRFDTLEEMMADLHARTTQFRRDYRRELKGQHRANLDEIFLQCARMPAAHQPLRERYRDHSLSGNDAKHRECHLKPALLLIYEKPDETLWRFARIGSLNSKGILMLLANSYVVWVILRYLLNKVRERHVTSLTDSN